MRFAYALGIIASCLLIFNCVSRAASVYYSLVASNQTEMEAAIPYLEKSAWLDQENPAPSYIHGMQLFSAGKYAEAVPELQRSIDLGRISVEDFSYLATAQILSGDLVAAENTFSHVRHLYPLSPFVLTRYATILKMNGKNEEAEAFLAKARSVDKAQANTWWSLMNEGGRQASIHAAAQSDDYVTVMHLTPEPAIYAIADEREIMHPEEKLRTNLDKKD